jgi:hypothetical protein
MRSFAGLGPQQDQEVALMPGSIPPNTAGEGPQAVYDPVRDVVIDFDSETRLATKIPCARPLFHDLLGTISCTVRDEPVGL